MKNKRGISLIVLIITIIVIIILAGAVLLNLSQNNPIESANKSKFASNLDNFNSELLMYSTKQTSNTLGEFDSTKLQANSTSITYTGSGTIDTTGTIASIITGLNSVSDISEFEIQNGKLVYVGVDTTKQTWATSTGITVGTVAVSSFGVNKVATDNVTINNAAASYNNPIIPKGFMAINTPDASWDNVSTDFDKGLVIKDANGNEFVWVPVDGTNVTYAKFGTDYFSYTQTTDDTLPTGVTSEQYQITKYGGFYIARYEAGKESTDTLVSKKGATSWTDIIYTDAKDKAILMYNTPEVKSGLVTGTQWDTTTKWIENANISIADSRSWGNHSDSTSPANISGFGTKQVTGYSENWKAKNIYDLAGNTWEWTNEIYSIFFVFRGGFCYGNGNNGSVTYRFGGTDTSSATDVSFRVVLYIS